MATIKSYTDISQSKTLSKILPLESADMLHCRSFDEDLLATVPKQYSGSFRHQPELTIPCWSLAALLGVLPLIDFTRPLLIGIPKTLYKCMYNDDLKSHAYDNPVDACVDMIEKLNESNLL